MLIDAKALREIQLKELGLIRDHLWTILDQSEKQFEERLIDAAKRQKTSTICTVEFTCPNCETLRSICTDLVTKFYKHSGFKSTKIVRYLTYANNIRGFEIEFDWSE